MITRHEAADAEENEEGLASSRWAPWGDWMTGTTATLILAVRVGMGGGETAGEGLQLGVGLRDRDTRREAAEEMQRARAAVVEPVAGAADAGPVGQRQPDVEAETVQRAEEGVGGDADDGEVVG